MRNPSTRSRSNGCASAIALSIALPIAAILSAMLFSAAAGANTPTAVVERALAQAREISDKQLDKPARLDLLRVVARDLFDTRAMGSRSIGPVIDEQTPSDRTEFLDLFDEFIVRAYLQKLLFFREPKFRLGNEEVSGDHTIVHTWIDTPKDSFEIDYRMVEQPNGWRADDVQVEGMSLGSNYGEQFRSILSKHDFEYLLEKMRRKVKHYREKKPERDES